MRRYLSKNATSYCVIGAIGVTITLQSCGSPPNDTCNTCDFEVILLQSVGGDDRDSLHVKGIIPDAQGNLLIGGEVGYQDVDFGDGPFSDSDGGVFVVKKDAAGNLVWRRSLSHPSLGGIAVTTDGSVVLGGSDYVAKYDSDVEQEIWTRTFFQAEGYPDLPGNKRKIRDVVVDGAGDVVLLGEFQGVMDAGGEPLQGFGDEDIFLVKLNASGDYLWGAVYGDTGEDLAGRISVSSDGTIVATGTFEGSIMLKNGDTITANMGRAPFLLQTSATGEPLWIKKIEASDDACRISRAVVNQSGVTVSGRFAGDLDLGGTVLSSDPEENGDNIFVVNYSIAGDYEWARSFGELGHQEPDDMVVTDDEIVLAGNFEGNGNLAFEDNLDLISWGTTHSESLHYDLFVAVLSLQGDHLWSARFGGPGDEALQRITEGEDGDLIFFGIAGAEFSIGDQAVTVEKQADGQLKGGFLTRLRRGSCETSGYMGCLAGP